MPANRAFWWPPNCLSLYIGLSTPGVSPREGAARSGRRRLGDADHRAARHQRGQLFLGHPCGCQNSVPAANRPILVVRSRVLAPHTLSVATCGELWLANLQEPPGVELRFEGNAYSHGHRSCDRARSTRRRPARRCCRWSVRLGSVQGRARGQGVAGAARYPAPDKARTLARSLRGVHSADCTQQPLSDLVGAPRARVTGFALPVLVEGLLSPFRQNATATRRSQTRGLRSARAHHAYRSRITRTYCVARPWPK